MLGAAIGILLGLKVLAPSTFVSGAFSLLTSLGISEYLLIEAGKAVCAKLGISTMQGAVLSQVAGCSASIMALLTAVCKVSEAIISYLCGNSSDINDVDDINNPAVQEIADQVITCTTRQQQSISSSSSQSSSSSSSSVAMSSPSANPYAFQPPPSNQSDRLDISREDSKRFASPGNKKGNE